MLKEGYGCRVVGLVIRAVGLKGYRVPSGPAERGFMDIGLSRSVVRVGC